ncbi:MAG: alanine racemase [Oceanospirillaceae bacterium]|nr:alanine racemase [Oceanospirillaceae bacterium]
MARAAQAIIDLSAIEYNFKLAKSQAKNAKAMAVIKADAYGHGAVAVANKLAPWVDAFGVACIEEALELREAGVSNPVLLLEGFFSADELPIIAENNFWTALHSTYQLDWLKNASLSQPINIWLKMDSGMHRLGLNSREFIDAYHQLQDMDNVAEIVLMTHMACADDLNSEMSTAQITLFDQACAGLNAEQSLANSPSILSNQASHRQWLRVGLMMYGASPFDVAHPIADKLKPAMHFTTQVIALRSVSNSEAVGYAASFVCETPKMIATIAIGYADGYDRHIVNDSPIMVAGQRAMIAGRISMDMVTVDVTGLKGVKIGSDVELWGDALKVTEVAKAASTIPYTLFTGVTKRVPRKYVNRDATAQ